MRARDRSREKDRALQRASVPGRGLRGFRVGVAAVALATTLAVPAADAGAGKAAGARSEAADPPPLPPPVEVVETVPVETPMNDPGIPDAWQVWPEVMDTASRSLDVASFYFSDRPENGQAVEPTRFDEVLHTMERAGARGVRVRVLADAGFYKTYPQWLDRLARAPNVTVRLIDFRALAGGPMHAKYFVVDGREAYVGSQNFDWRSLEHIHEMGLHLRIPAYAALLEEVFDMDWQAGKSPGGQEAPGDTTSGGDAYPLGVNARRALTLSFPFCWVDATGDSARLWPALSPRGFLPDTTTWDLPLLLRWIAEAKDSVHVTALTYSPITRDGTFWPVLDNALRAAAVRGVAVRLLFSDWNTRKPAIDFLKSLVVVPGIEVRLVSVPEASEGFIPFARVTHAKYMTVDGRRLWLGTSNWEESYFTKTRNVGVVAESRELTRTLDRDFGSWWNSVYAYPVQPGREYTPPRTSD